MKKKDIIILAVCVVFIVGAFVVMYFTLFPSRPGTTAITTTNTNTTTNQQTAITSNLDQDTLNKINGLKNYVSTNLDNIGRTDPFGPLR
jgi:flagellar basal body-associated protein FliL